MPDVAINFGSAPGLRPPSRASAFTIGRAEPSSCAEPASARNSRVRENRRTMIVATNENMFWQNIAIIGYLEQLRIGRTRPELACVIVSKARTFERSRNTISSAS
jgi:hypothetical protein